MRKIEVIDSTLKTASKLSFREKTEIAKSLDSLGVYAVELSACNGSKEEAVVNMTIAQSIKNAKVAIPVGMSEQSLESAWEAVKASNKPCLQIEVPTSTVGMEYTCHMKSPKMLAFCEKLIGMAKEKCDDVELVALDASRADREFLLELIKSAYALGASSCTVCDDAGIYMPEDFCELINDIKKACDIDIFVCPSDELGMAPAICAGAIKAGATGIKATIGSSGAKLFEIANILKLKGDDLGVTSTLDYTKCRHECERIKNILADSKAEAVNASILNASELVLSGDSTLGEICDALKTLGYDLSEEDQGKVYDELLRLASKRKEISSKEFEAIIATSAMQVPSTYHVESYVSNSGNIMQSMATITLIKDGEKFSGVATGDGPIDAAFKAIEQIIGHHYELDDFKITAVTQGKEAVGEAIVKLRTEGKLYSGSGISTDIIGASIRAYINALNKIVFEN